MSELVLFKRFGVPPEKRDWEVGYVSDFFTPSEATSHGHARWAAVVPAAPEGKQAPTSLTVPDDPRWLDRSGGTGEEKQ